MFQSSDLINTKEKFESHLINYEGDTKRQS